MKIKFSLPYKRIITYAYFVVIVGGLATIGYVGRFLYQDFYLALTQSESLIDLGIKASTESVNLKKFETIMTRMEKKKASSTVPVTRNLFD